MVTGSAVLLEAMGQPAGFTWPADPGLVCASAVMAIGVLQLGMSAGLLVVLAGLLRPTPRPA